MMEGSTATRKKGNGAPSGWETSVHNKAPQLQPGSGLTSPLSPLRSFLQGNAELMHCLFSPEDSVSRSGHATHLYL